MRGGGDDVVTGPMKPVLLLPALPAIWAVVPCTLHLSAADDGGFFSLFDGKTLDGWEQHSGKAEYRVEDGAIVGKTVANTDNSFLCTKKQYGDFILEFEFKVHPQMNSGVQFRSEFYKEPTEVEINGK